MREREGERVCVLESERGRGRKRGLRESYRVNVCERRRLCVLVHVQERVWSSSSSSFLISRQYFLQVSHRCINQSINFNERLKKKKERKREREEREREISIPAGLDCLDLKVTFRV